MLTKNFDITEFSCKDRAKTPVPNEFYLNVSLLAINLQIIRDKIQEITGREYHITIHSGFRTPEQNKEVGGAVNSYHLKALAGDIIVPGYNMQNLFNQIKTLMLDGQIIKGGLKYYKEKNFIHYDCRGMAVFF